MSKPSIFSKDYDEKMKKRKRNIIIGTISVLIIIALALFIGDFKVNANREIKTGLNKIKDKIADIMIKDSSTKPKEEEKEKEEIISKQDGDNKEPIPQDKKTETPKEQMGEYSIKLSKGEEVKLNYTILNNEKTFSGINPDSIKHHISPSKKNLVILDNSSQSLILIDINGNKKDITNSQYVSSKGTVFTKDNVLKANGNYIWCDSPKFLNEDNIIYLSQLPWFNKENVKYVWKYNISSNTYQHNLGGNVGEVSGIEIKYGNLTPEGLEVIVDGITKIIK